MSERSRPLSPHLQIYRLQWTMLLSITHRITGVALAVGALALVWWLVALAVGPEYFAYAQAIMGSWLGRLVLLGWTWAAFYHLCNGIRHLIWDGGWGLELRAAWASGMLVATMSVVLTLAAWLVAYAARGG